MTTNITEIEIWETSEKIVSFLKGVRQVCKVVQGTIDAADLDLGGMDLMRYLTGAHPPSFNKCVLLLFGRAYKAGHPATTNPLRHSRHAYALQIAHDAHYAIQEAAEKVRRTTTTQEIRKALSCIATIAFKDKNYENLLAKVDLAELELEAHAAGELLGEGQNLAEKPVAADESMVDDNRNVDQCACDWFNENVFDKDGSFKDDITWTKEMIAVKIGHSTKTVQSRIRCPGFHTLFSAYRAADKAKRKAAHKVFGQTDGHGGIEAWRQDDDANDDDWDDDV